MHNYIQRVETAITAFQQGKMVILTDHPDRENEGDVIFPAEIITPEIISFMIRYCSGIICLPMMPDQLQHLNLPLMLPAGMNTNKRGTPFTVSIEAREGITTGVSAADRAQTILTAVNDDATEFDLVKPGHVFPLQAREGGVFEREGHTEGSVDLARLAGFKPAAVLCEVMNEDGTMTRGQDLEKFAVAHDLPVLSIDDIIAYRRLKENLIAEQANSNLPTSLYGDFTMTVIKEKYTDIEHTVLSKPVVSQDKAPLVRVHSACLTGDLFSSMRCDCHQQLQYSLQQIKEQGGYLIYLNQEGRGIGLFNKIKAYALQEKGLDTIDANLQLGMPVDCRSYHIAANVLRNQKISAIRLLTNNPAKINELEKYGIQVNERVSLPLFSNAHNISYLTTKKNKLNHFIQEASHD